MSAATRKVRRLPLSEYHDAAILSQWPADRFRNEVERLIELLGQNDCVEIFYAAGAEFLANRGAVCDLWLEITTQASFNAARRAAATGVPAGPPLPLDACLYLGATDIRQLQQAGPGRRPRSAS